GLASAASTACQPQIQSSAPPAFPLGGRAPGRAPPPGRNPPWPWRFRPRRASLRSLDEATIRRAPNWGPRRGSPARNPAFGALSPSHPAAEAFCSKALTRLLARGGMSRAAKGADCKSAGVRLRRFESYFPHHALRATAERRNTIGGYSTMVVQQP